MKYFIVLITIISFTRIYSQNNSYLYMPDEIQKAYTNKTRNFDGIPGENYFTNKTDYKIKVSFDPKTRLVKGNEVITYTNNSPDSLEIIYLNVYMDIFKKGNVRDWSMGDVDITDGIKITKVKINNIEIENDRNKIAIHSAILSIKPQKALLSKSESTIEIDWEFTYQGTITVRGGQYGKNNFFVSYWYPKVTVYDDISGWNKRGHTGVQEFYNDFGDFDVEITVPKEYSVWSTASLQNTNEIYQDKILQRINESKNSDKVIHIITPEDRDNKNILRKVKKNRVWKFKSENTPDFAFAISKTYIWDATSIESGNRRIWINTAYKKESTDFKDVAQISKNAIDFFTNKIPAIPYPYAQFTAFNGGGGMEFPGMVNDGDSKTYNSTLYLTAHEMGHSYFPFYTGLNEQKYAWMDEGLITFFPQLFVEKYSTDTNYIFFKRTLLYYNKYANTMVNVPLMVTSDNLSAQAYRHQAYSRSSTAFYVLFKYLGEEKFSKALQLFTKRWNGKHPTPYDLFYTFNHIADENLEWFWKPWFFEMGAANLSLGEIIKDKEKIFIVINNSTGFPVSINLKVKYSDETEETYQYKCNIWKNKDSFKIELKNKNIKTIELDSDSTPDANRTDNKIVF